MPKSNQGELYVEGISTNTLALPTDKMFVHLPTVFTLWTHTRTNNLFQSIQSEHFHLKKWFITTKGISVSILYIKSLSPWVGGWLGVLLAFSTVESARPITDHRLAFSMAEPVRTDGRTDGRVFFRKEQRSKPLLPLVFCFALEYQEAPLVFCFVFGLF